MIEFLQQICDIIVDGWWILLIIGIMAAVLGFLKEEESEYESLEEWYHQRPLKTENNKTEEYDK